MKAKMDEIWKDIADIRGYQIRNFGNVRSVDRIVNHPNSPNKQAIKKGQPIKPFINKGGYKEVVLLKKCFVGAGYNKVHRTIHRLVAQAFLENPNKYEEINHKDENKANNIASNLEWCTRKYNVYYGTGIERKEASRAIAIKEGRTGKNIPRNCGENNPNAKLSDADVLYIREHYKKNDKEFGGVPLAKKFGITKCSLYRIIKNQRRKM